MAGLTDKPYAGGPKNPKPRPTNTVTKEVGKGGKGKDMMKK